MNTTEDISNYSLINKRLTGTTLKLFFKRDFDDKPQKVLELKNIIAFIDDFKNQELRTIEVKDFGGTYGVDMAIKLRRPELEKYHEVFIFSKDVSYQSVFRALAETIIWIDYNNQQVGDINY